MTEPTLNNQATASERLGQYAFVLVGVWAAIQTYLEASAYLQLKRQREFITFAAWRDVYYVLLGLFALGLLAGLASPFISRLIAGRRFPGWLRWSLSAAVIVADAWFFLYAPWQRANFGRWSQALLILGSVAGMAAIVYRPTRVGWRELIVTVWIQVYVLAVMEARKYLPEWGYRGVTILEFLSVFIGVLALYENLFVERMVAAVRALRIPYRRLLAAALIIYPFYLLLATDPQIYFMLVSLRLSLFLLFLPFIALLLARDVDHIELSDWVLGISLMGFCIIAAAPIASNSYVAGYPFSLSWSEGNRFYDYSLIFAKDLYNYPGQLSIPYFAPGRYALWGVLFLIPGLSLLAHRFWDSFLRIGLPLGLGWLSSPGLKDWRLRLGFTLGVYLFAVRVGIYEPLLLSLIIVVVASREPGLTRRLLAVSFASLYAGLSRQTWAPAAGIWAALADLLIFYPTRAGGLLKRLWPAVALGFAGTLPGVIAGWENLFGMATGNNLATQQPLLWYRLLPNLTYGYGILIGAAVVMGPLVLLLAWLIASKTWELDGLQKAAVLTAGVVLFAVGVIISTKIGGGSNLHNLDMLSGMIIVLSAIACNRLAEGGKPLVAAAPLWVRGIAILYVVLALSRLFARTTFDRLPEQKVVNRVLATIRLNVDRYTQQGEILFMDQRQLVTFGYIKGVPFVPEYEKKFMMDQAMASNAGYFQQYYRDLERGRFSLIITEPLRLDLVNWGDLEGSFREENDLWVKWVSTPTLCFYEPLYTSKNTHIQLLVPREDTSGCSIYLSP